MPAAQHQNDNSNHLPSPYREAGRGLTGRWHVPDAKLQFSSPYVGMGNNPASMIDPDGMWTDAAYMSDLTGFDAYRLSKYRTAHNYNRKTNVLGKSLAQERFEKVAGEMDLRARQGFENSIDNIIIGVSNYAGVDASRSVITKSIIENITTALKRLNDKEKIHAENSISDLNGDGSSCLGCPPPDKDNDHHAQKIVSIDVFRIISPNNQYTMGVFSIDNGEIIGFTLEPPGPDSNVEGSNKRIPEGTYNLKPYSSTKYSNVWEVENVPGRTKILIHGGNKVEETTGCIIIAFERISNGYLYKTALPNLNKYIKSQNPSNITINIYNFLLH